VKKALIAFGALIFFAFGSYVWMNQRAAYENPLFAQNPARTFEFTSEPAQGFILTNDMVRVMFFEHDAAINAAPRVLLRNIRALVVEENKDKTFRAVLDVDAGTADQIRAAQKMGKVWLALQPVGD
jgi:hypothetical protein